MCAIVAIWSLGTVASRSSGYFAVIADSSINGGSPGCREGFIELLLYC